METIAKGVALAKAEGVSIGAAAERMVDEAKSRKERLSGMGHRVHSHDPRKDVLFGMAREFGVAGDGVAFMLALETAVAAKIKPLPINIDGVLAAVLHDLGFQPIFGAAGFHYWARCGHQRGGGRGVGAGEGDADQGSGGVRRAGAAGASLAWEGGQAADLFVINTVA